MDVSAHIRKMLRSLKKTCELNMKYDDSANLDQFIKMARDTIQIDIRNTNVLEAIDLADEPENEEQFDEVLKDSFEMECNEETIKCNPLYKDFEEFVRELLLNKASATSVCQSKTQTTLSNGMEITETIGAVDPITKGPLIRPVRNRHCNHIYGYQSVIDSLSINRRLRCPMIGCANKTHIIPEDLIEI